MNRTEWHACVASRLGYPGQVPWYVHASIEAFCSAGVSALAAVERLRGLRADGVAA